MPNPALAWSGLAWKYYAKRLRRQSTVSFAYKLAVAICCDRQRIHASISISTSGDQSLFAVDRLAVLSHCRAVSLSGQLTHWSTARHNSIISVSAYVGRRCQIFSARLNDQRRQAAAPRHRLPVSTLAPVQSTCFCCFRSRCSGLLLLLLQQCVLPASIQCVCRLISLPIFVRSLGPANYFTCPGSLVVSMYNLISVSFAAMAVWFV